MRIIVHASAEAATTAVADALARTIRAAPAIRIGLPSGRTPLPMYRALVQFARRSRLSFRQATIFGLDEFVGVAARDPRSYAAYFHRELLDHINVDRRNIHLMNGATRDALREARRFDRTLAAGGGLDVVVLGIGVNGHVGFNEPADALSPDTHVVRLHPRTRRANARAFGGIRHVPTRALSMGIGTILRARAVILIATGPSKARVIARACAGPVTTRVPASLLQLHPNVVVVLDREAARAL
jgi:glucosamine-6-phosphate deaminase